MVRRRCSRISILDLAARIPIMVPPRYALMDLAARIPESSECSKPFCRSMRQLCTHLPHMWYKKVLVVRLISSLAHHKFPILASYRHVSATPSSHLRHQRHGSAA